MFPGTATAALPQPAITVSPGRRQGTIREMRNLDGRDALAKVNGEGIVSGVRKLLDGTKTIQYRVPRRKDVCYVTDTLPLSISDKAVNDMNVREGLTLLRQHGFTHVHFSQGWRSTEPLDDVTVDQWQQDLAAAGMAVLDVHACHPLDRSISLWDENPDNRAHAARLFESRLRLTHALGGDAMVYHVPTRVEPEPAVIQRFVESLAAMEEIARELNIVVALENHFLHDNDRVAFPACFERFSPEYIGFCFDSGHAIRSGNTEWLMDNCFDRLKVLHLHDNEPGKDRHWLPFTPGGHVDWDQVARAIAASPYDKPLQLEVGWKEGRYDNREDYARRAYTAAMKVQEKVDSCRGANSK